LADGRAVFKDCAASSDRYPRQGARRRPGHQRDHSCFEIRRTLDRGAPPDYGPKKTLYNRYVRWAAKGVWVDLFHALAQAGGPPVQVLIDSSAVKAHRSASGGKGGRKIRPSGARAADARPKSTP